MIMLARGFCNAIRQAKHKSTLTSSPLGRGAGEGIELIECFDTAGRIAAALAETRARQTACVGFIDSDHLVNTVHKPSRDGILEYAGALSRRALDDKNVACERMN